jgi:hypothetical protein
MMHVLPINDAKKHKEGLDCFCSPAYRDGVYVHNSADGRELLREAIEADTIKKSLEAFSRHQARVWLLLPNKQADRITKYAVARLFAAWQAHEFEVIVDNPTKDA